MSSAHSTGPTVGNLATALVTALGFRDVDLFGLDLGSPLTDGTTRP
jgi:hypothetical protein